MPKKSTHFSTFKKLNEQFKKEIEEKRMLDNTKILYLQASLRLRIIKKYENFLKKHGYYSKDNTKPMSIYSGEEQWRTIVKSIEEKYPEIVKKLSKFKL